MNIQNYPYLRESLLIMIFDSYKIGLVHTLLFQFLKIFSKMENFYIEVERLRSILKYNNYPVNMIDQCIKKFWKNFMSLSRLCQQYLKEIICYSFSFRIIFFEFERTFV